MDIDPHDRPPSASALGAELALPYLLDERRRRGLRPRGSRQPASPAPASRRRCCRCWWRRCGERASGRAPRGAGGGGRRRRRRPRAGRVGGAVPAGRRRSAYLPSRGAAYGSGLEPAAAPGGRAAAALDALARGWAGGGVGRRAGRADRAGRPAGRRSVELDSASEPGFDGRSSSCWPRPGTSASTPSRSAASFSVRGGLVDVFPTTGREPIRVEFFGDEIERLSAFSAVHPALAARPRPRRSCIPPPSPATWSSDWGAEEDEPAIPAGLVALRAGAGAARARCWSGIPSRSWRRSTRHSEEAADRLRDAAAAAARLRAAAARSRRWSSARARSRSCRWGSRSRSRRSRRRWPRSASPRPRTSCARWCGPATACWSASRTWVRPSAPGWR